jgi:O-antigen/teichoic acid export membrane protein
MGIRLLFSNSLWSIVSKLTNALIQLVSLPVLISVFGKSDYGLIVIAMSLNSFIAIIQFGLPTGLPKFVAEWLTRKEDHTLAMAIRSVSSFYIGIAVINFLILITIALFWPNLLNVSFDQIPLLQTLLIITAVTSFFAIPATVLDQTLMGAQELGFVSFLEMIKNLFFAALVISLYFFPKSFSLSEFYSLRCFLMFVMVPWKIHRWRKYGTISVFLPGWNFTAVWPLLKYCLSLATFSIFIALSERLRPVILGIRVANDAGEVLSDFQIINYVRIFLLMIGASIRQALVPYISGSAAGDSSNLYQRTIEQGTKFVWAAGALVGFGIIMLSEEVLCIYVGVQNLYLQIWLIVLIGATTYRFYITPIASVILSSGQLSPMIAATGTGCVLSLTTCWLTVPTFGVGSFAIALVVNNLVHFLVTHFWYLPRYFNLKPIRQIVVFMLPPIFAGAVMCLSGRWLLDMIGFKNDYINIAFGIVWGTFIYTFFIVITGYIPWSEGIKLLRKLKKK